MEKPWGAGECRGQTPEEQVSLPATAQSPLCQLSCQGQMHNQPWAPVVPADTGQFLRVRASKTICTNPSQASTTWELQVRDRGLDFLALPSHTEWFENMYPSLCCLQHVFKNTASRVSSSYTEPCNYTHFFLYFFKRKTGKRFGWTPGTAMRSRGWSLSHHKYWQRRFYETHQKPKIRRKLHVFPHIYTGACSTALKKKRSKRSLKIPFSNKSHLLQQNYSGKYGNFESRFLTLHHLPADKTNRFGKHTSCSVNIYWNMQNWECSGRFTAVTCRQANIALSLWHCNFCCYSDLCFTGFEHNCAFPCKSVLQAW